MGDEYPKHEIALTLSVDWKISCKRRTLFVSMYHKYERISEKDVQVLGYLGESRRSRNL